MTHPPINNAGDYLITTGSGQTYRAASEADARQVADWLWSQWEGRRAVRYYYNRTGPHAVTIPALPR